MDTPLTRRDLLTLAGAATAASLTRRPAAAEPLIALPPLPPGLACVVRPQQTEGPYFVDGALNRADIRSDPSAGRSVPGAPLELRIVVHRVSGTSCAPLPGAQVDLWQCDALGVYSGVRDFQGLFDTRGRQFLRGFQTSGADGAARFTTIFPGWYEGRAPHLHFKVRVPGAGRSAHEFTSQLYVDDDLATRVYARPPYNAKTGRRTTNRDDRIFLQRGSGDQLMLPLIAQGDGFTGTFELGLAF